MNWVWLPRFYFEIWFDFGRALARTIDSNRIAVQWIFCRIVEVHDTKAIATREDASNGKEIQIRECVISRARKIISLFYGVLWNGLQYET